jgi:hypothetical protein
MPYLWRLAQRYAYASDYSAITHPSLPNYLAIFSGSAFSDPPDCSPGPGCSYPGPSVFGQALARGKTARAYQESMPAPCDQSDSGNYVVRHNPWAYIPAEAAACRAGDVPFCDHADGSRLVAVRMQTWAFCALGTRGAAGGGTDFSTFGELCVDHDRRAGG